MNVTKIFDAAVVGGGVIGLATARELAGRGLHIVLIERNARVGMEASHAAAGMLAPQAEANAADDFFRLCAASRDLYPRFAAELLAETNIDIEFDETGTLYLAFVETDEAELSARFAWQRDAGLSVERLSANDVREIEPNLSRDVRFGLRFPRDTQIEPRCLVAALEKSCKLRGVRIITNAEVSSLKIERGHVCGVGTSRGFIASKMVIIAGGAWSSFVEIPNFEMPQIEPVRGQMLCFDARPPKHLDRQFMRHVVYSPRGYIVPRRDGRMLAGSTSELVGFNKNVTEEGKHAIEKKAREIAPEIARLELIDSWAGLRPHAKDDLPLIGRATDEIQNLYFAAGHFRNGILLAPLTADALAALIVDNELAPLIVPFTPERMKRIAASHST